jgi:hypothetical protein
MGPNVFLGSISALLAFVFLTAVIRPSLFLKIVRRFPGNGSGRTVPRGRSCVSCRTVFCMQKPKAESIGHHCDTSRQGEIQKMAVSFQRSKNGLYHTTWSVGRSILSGMETELDMELD